MGLYGAENMLIALAAELSSSDYTPVIGVIHNKKSPHLELREVAEKNNIESVVFASRGAFDISTMIDILRYIRNNKIDLIQTHGYKSNVYAVLATLFSRAYSWHAGSCPIRG